MSIGHMIPFLRAIIICEDRGDKDRVTETYCGPKGKSHVPNPVRTYLLVGPAQNRPSRSVSTLIDREDYS